MTLLPARPGPERARAAAVLALGAAVIAWLTRYNSQPLSAWSSPAIPAYRSWEEYLTVNCTALMLLPCLLVLGALRERPCDYGFQPATKDAWRLAMLFLAAMLPVLLAASRFPVFYNHYPLQSRAGENAAYFAYFQLTYGFYFLCWEWFYRGFLTFGLARGFGAAPAIALQAVGFGIMHIGKPLPEVYGSFVAGAALGWLALRGRSFFPCFVLHWTCSLLFDVLAIQARPGGLW